MSALSIPLMISKGIKEEMAMNVFVAGSILSIVNDIVGGWLSEQCSCRLGRIGAILEFYESSVFTRKVFLGIRLVDFITVDTLPKA